MSTTEDIVPDFCTPVSAIGSKNYLIITNKQGPTGERQLNPLSLHRQRQQIMEAQVVGKYQIDDNLLQELQQQWHEPDCLLMCATDGGLKDQVKKSSHAVFFPEISTPIVTGRAAEWQPSTDASSTKQELLGQLGLEFWLSRLEKTMGKTTP